MKPIAVVAAIALFTTGTHGQLLVTPRFVLARHASTDVFGTAPPTGAGDNHTTSMPSAFGNSTAHILSSPTTGNQVARSSGYATEFFWGSPGGLSNSIYTYGQADARAQVGASNTANITATATSYTRVEFEVTESVAYHFVGAITLGEVSGFGPGFGTCLAEMTLSRGFTPVHSFAVSSVANAVHFDLTGVLQPGSYLLQAEAASSGTAVGLNALWAANSGYSGRLDFTPIPAPAAGLVLAGAIVVLGRRDRSRRAS